MDRNARVLIRVLSVLGGDRVLLRGQGLPGVDTAVLENYSGVAENEVDCSVNVGFPDELAVGVDVKCVLVSDDVAAVDDGVVGPDSEGYGLVLAGPGPILKRYVPCNKTSSSCRCGQTTTNKFSINASSNYFYGLPTHRPQIIIQLGWDLTELGG